MTCSTPQKLKLSLVGLAILIAVCPALLRPSEASSDNGRLTRIQHSRNQNLILFNRGNLDTAARLDLDTSSEDLRPLNVNSATASKHTRIIQFGGPIKRAWIDSLLTNAVEIVGYIPNNAYIIRGDERQLARVAELDAGPDADDARPIRWMGRLAPTQKLDPTYSDEMLGGSSAADVNVEVELVDSPDSLLAIDAIARVASNTGSQPRRFLDFVVISATLAVNRLLEIAALDEVLFVGPASTIKLHDERSAQIVAGNLTSDQTQPSGPGYMAWLATNGLDAQSDFVVDVTDSGIDRGSTTASQLSPCFLDSGLQSRVAYTLNYATDGLKDDRTGHGTLVASVAGGRGSASREDAPGYMYGLGVDPYAQLGSSRLFDERGKAPSQISFTSMASAAYSAGARVSNNSWGNTSNNYDSFAQEYDALVRDAQPSTPGNQEMVFVFSVANAGPGGHVGSPATAKNVISVAASENYRPEGVDSCNLDGKGNIGPDGADNALDILRFSSGGPTADGRAKPDIAAPGTHIFGAASQSSGFFGEGLCAGPGVFQPPDQAPFYTWSSGTSLAAPHISGAASLFRKFFIPRNLPGGHRAPSPAMTKAFLINSASYMTGENAGGNLPGERQGWGLVDLSRTFDDAKRVLIDQAQLFTESRQKIEIPGSIADRSRPLRVTLAWTDAPGSLIGPAIVNDLDLEIVVGGVTVYRGNNFVGAYSVEGGEPDRLNNVESIYLQPDVIPPGVPGNFIIRVSAANIAGDGVPGNETNLDQDFALAIYNIGAPIQPPPPPPPNIPVISSVTYLKKTLNITGQNFTAAAQVQINGQRIDRVFDFDSATKSLSLRLKRGKLNLNDGDNQIVLIEGGQVSLPFVLRL
jgi:subtilase family protein